MNESNFIESLRSFYNHIRRESIVPFENSEEKVITLKKLYQDIKNNTYQPTFPREYIISNKSNYVSRIIPTFSLRDYCLYFYCIKNLQDFLCDDKERVEGTFGGWRISNPIKSVEDIEKEGLLNDYAWYDFYVSISTLTSQNWFKNWKEFSTITYTKAINYTYERGFDDYIVATFDIANFYDNIKFDILENKLRLKCQSTNQNKIIDLLMYFLRYWNKPFEGYFPKSVGLPQEETGDCSRILANFYLRDYDKKIKRLCDENVCDYVRFADDMLIFAPNQETAEFVLFEASKLLHKLGLNINCGKVKFFNKEDFLTYQSFDILTLLNDANNKDNFNNAISLYFQNKDSQKAFRSDRVIRRIISILANKNSDFLEPIHKTRLFAELLDKEVLSTANALYLKKVYRIMKTEGMEQILLKKLDELISCINFNSFHYTLLRFYKSIKKVDFDKTRLMQEIEKRKVIHLTNNDTK